MKPTNNEDMPGLIDVSDSEDDNDDDEDDDDDFASCIPSKDKGKGKVKAEPEDAKAKVKVKAKDESKMKGDNSKGKEKVKVSTKGGRKKGAKNFSREDTEGLLGLVKAEMPLGQSGWNKVTDIFNVWAKANGFTERSMMVLWKHFQSVSV